MKASPSQGFTLLELLVVIAVSAILASVLIPNLLTARLQAQERAAQMYSSSVYKAMTAILATDSHLSAADVVGGSYNCGPDADATDGVEIDGVVYNYGWPAAPGSVTACNITVNTDTGGIDVEITTTTATFVNGATQ